MATRIIVNNIKSKLECSVPLLIKVRNHGAWSMRVDGAFFSPAFRKGQWDGKFNFMNERGVFDTGKLPSLLDTLELMSEDYEIVDERITIEPKFKINKLGGYSLRDYQKRALLGVGNNTVGGIKFHISNINFATNAGKSITSAGIHKMYGVKTLMLINSKELMEEAMRELPKFLPGQVGSLTSNEIEWNDFMVLMIKTTLNRIKYDPKNETIKKLQEYDVLIIDEADLATSPTYTKVLSMLFHCKIRVGLSGTLWASRKDRVKTEKLRALFGKQVAEITNTEMIKLGYSSDLEVTIVDGNQILLKNLSYQDEYLGGITQNNKRHLAILDRVKYHLKLGHTPMLIFCQFHEHIENLHRILKMGVDKKYSLDWTHHERKDRKEVTVDFRDGKIDILVGSKILSRGKNFPLIKYIINAGGGYGATGILQGPIGRAVRKHESKEITYVEDMFDQGEHLSRHSRKRRATYKAEGFKVIDNYTKKYTI